MKAKDTSTKNYVKIVARITNSSKGLAETGNPREEVKLFIKENDTYKVLRAIQEKHFTRTGDQCYVRIPLSVDMRKAIIPNRRRERVQPIVDRSMAWVAAN